MTTECGIQNGNSILIGTIMTRFEPYNLYWQELLLEQSSRWLRSIITEEVKISKLEFIALDAICIQVNDEASGWNEFVIILS